MNFPQHDTAVVSLRLLYNVFIRNIRIFETVDYVFKEHLSRTVAVCRYNYVIVRTSSAYYTSKSNLMSIPPQAFLDNSRDNTISLIPVNTFISYMNLRKL